jgi:hypothetical protein
MSQPVKNPTRIEALVATLPLLAGGALGADRFPLYWIGPVGERVKAAGGDVDGDGMSDVVLFSYAPSFTPGSPQQAFVRSGLNGSLIHSWTPSLSSMPAFQGAPMLKPSGDLNSDGFGDVALPIMSPVGTAGGAVEVRSGLNGSVMAVLPPPFTIPSFFGTAIAGAGDMDGDTWPELLVAGPHLTLACTAVYNFEAPNFTLQYYSSQCGGAFGRSLGPLDDVDGDGLPDFYVGAPEAFSGWVLGGWIGIYSGATGSLITSLGGNTHYQQLGNSVAALSDVTGDGNPEIAVVRWAGPLPFGNFGVEVSVLSLPTFSTVYAVTASSLGAYTLSEVDSLGDADGDGLSDFLIRWHSQQNYDIVTAISGPTGAMLGQIAHPYPTAQLGGFGLGDVNGDGLGDLAASSFVQPSPLLPPFTPPLGMESLYSPWFSPMTTGQAAIHVARNFDLLGTPTVGGTAQFEVVAPRRAGKPFQIAFSQDWFFPGFPLGPFLFPLVMDGLFWASVSAGIGGVLDGSGHATFALPIPNDPALHGLVFQASGVVYDPASPLGIGCVLTQLPIVIP